MVSVSSMASPMTRTGASRAARSVVRKSSGVVPWVRRMCARAPVGASTPVSRPPSSAAIRAEELKTMSPDEKTTRPPADSTAFRSAANLGSLLDSYSLPFT